MTLQANPLFEFDRFRLDPAEHLLQCDGKPVPLTPKAFEILVALLQSNGRLLTKDELMRKVWPDSFVEEANLTVNISALRKVLGDGSGGKQYIETVPKRGYRFVATVTELEGTSPAKLPAAAPTQIEPETTPPGPLTPEISSPRGWIVALVLAGIAASIGGYVTYRHHPAPVQVSVGPRGVLPFCRSAT